MEKTNLEYWPNPDGDLGVNKVAIPDGVNTFWPDGDALVGNFVYKDGKLVGFVDTKALTVNESKSTTFPYDYVNIQVDKSLEGTMTFNKGERTKYLTISYTTSGTGGSETFDFVIIDFNTTDQETINTLRTAKRVVDNKLYDADGGLIGTWDTSKLEVGGIFDLEGVEDGLFLNVEADGVTERGLILSEFNSDLSSLRAGSVMFAMCSSLTSFSSDMPSLTNGEGMFIGCHLTTFSSDLSSLKNGFSMFGGCPLTSFSSDLPNLTNGSSMFYGCKLDTASVQNIADTIKNVSSLTDGSSPGDEVYRIIIIDIGNSTPNDQEKTAFNTIVSKGWTVFVNGSKYTPSTVSSIMTLDESGNEVETPIPYYAKPVPATEETASYTDGNGNFFNILGAQFIYGDDISTYGMFTCEEDAAANMRLTKIEKPSISKFALKR